MENILKLIIMGAGVILTCMVVAMGFYLGSESRLISSVSTSRITEFSSELTESNLSMYDKLEVNGSDVINLIKKELGDYSNSETGQIYVKVITSLAENIYVNNSFIVDCRNFTSNKYIKPIAKFQGEVIKNTNNVIVGIEFMQK